MRGPPGQASPRRFRTYVYDLIGCLDGRLEGAALQRGIAHHCVLTGYGVMNGSGVSSTQSCAEETHHVHGVDFPY